MPGMTNDEVCEFVYTYEQQPYGMKHAWLESRGVTKHQFRRWRAAVFEGDLSRGLVPRETGLMTSSSQRRFVAKQYEKAEAENERLRERVAELEAVNEALGKAIGLLHQLNEQEPDARPSPAPQHPAPSSRPRTNSFGISPS
ncbi:hypothetical protein [Leucobacter chinensis]|uniref:hypothetical protein n=1 Tax=Leucobacter chinensis TaxID=2851010 RepID=UPI003510A8FD